MPPDIDARIAIDIGRTRVGAIALDGLTARLVAHHRGLTLDSLTARGLGFDIAASGELASDATLHGKLVISGTTTEAIRVLDHAGIAVGMRVPPIPRLAVTLTAAGKLDGELTLDIEPSRLAIAGGRVAIAGHAELDHGRVRRASTTIELHGLDLGALARLARRRAPALHGSLSGTVALARTPQTQRADYQVVVALPASRVEAHGSADMSTADVQARLVRTADREVLATATAHVAHDAHGTLSVDRGWHVVVDAPRRTFGELADLARRASPRLASKLPATIPEGDVALHADLGGTPSQPRGAIDLVAHAMTPAGREAAMLHVALAPGPGGVAVTTHGTLGDGAAPLIALDGTAALPRLFAAGTLDLAALRRDVTFDQVIAIPERSLASVPMVPPEVARLGGTVGGRLEVHGSPRAPALAGAFAWRDYPVASGATGAATVELTGTPARLDVKLISGPVLITAQLERAGDRVALDAHVHSEPTALAPLLPAAIAPDFAGNDPGTLRADLGAQLALAITPHGVALADASVTGGLSVRGGTVRLHGDRRWHDLDLELAGDPRGVRLVKLAAHETDAQVADRTLEVSGVIALAQQRDAGGALVVRPQRGELAISAHDWLVLGSGSPLFSDAPVASVDLDATLTADLAAPVVAIDATVRRLELSSPDRLDRSHQPELASVSGDIIYLDETHAPAGTLPVPPVAAPPRLPHVPLDIRIHVPQPVHVLKAPLDLEARGELTVRVRDGGVATRGTLTALGGSLTLFGREHALVSGTLAFTDAHPHGEFALAFEHPLPPEVVRALSRPDAASHVTITGTPAKPIVGLGGASNVTLAEVLAMYHAGHPVYLAPPGRYPSSTTQVPRGDQFLVFGYLSSALPHFLFLDRIAAWADPNDPRAGYGQIRHLEATRYAADRRGRVRVVGRPTVPGRSSAELQLDHLWLDTGRVLFGAGLRAGDRLGGGLGLFVEWSSAR